MARNKYEAKVPRYMTKHLRDQIMRTEKALIKKQAYLDKLKYTLEQIDKINDGEKSNDGEEII